MSVIAGVILFGLFAGIPGFGLMAAYAGADLFANRVWVRVTAYSVLALLCYIAVGFFPETHLAGCNEWIRTNLR